MFVQSIAKLVIGYFFQLIAGILEFLVCNMLTLPHLNLQNDSQNILLIFVVSSCAPFSFISFNSGRNFHQCLKWAQ
jgi:hypothetical protein